MISIDGSDDKNRNSQTDDGEVENGVVTTELGISEDTTDPGGSVHPEGVECTQGEGGLDT